MAKTCCRLCDYDADVLEAWDSVERPSVVNNYNSGREHRCLVLKFLRSALLRRRHLMQVGLYVSMTIDIFEAE